MDQARIIRQLESSPGVRKCVIDKDIPNVLFGPYRCKVHFGKDETGIIGRGSLNAIQGIESFASTHAGGHVIEIGDMCEIANAKILLGGEHENTQPINNHFSYFPDIALEATKQGANITSAFSKGPVVIGSNVVISRNVTVLSGVRIGNGAVIAAGSVVSKDIPDFAIAGGVPAKVIKYRFDEKTREALNEIRWWDMTPESLGKHYAAIQAIATPGHLEKLRALDASHYRETTKEYLVFESRKNTNGSTDVSFSGVEIQGRFLRVEQLPEIFLFFLTQLSRKADETVYLVPDIFALAGLKNG